MQSDSVTLNTQMGSLHATLQTRGDPMNRRRLLHISCGVALAVLLAAPMPLCAQQAAGGGFLKVKASPGRAGVFVDGKYLGPAANFR